jgi:hypothetical protein
MWTLAAVYSNQRFLRRTLCIFASSLSAAFVLVDVYLLSDADYKPWVHIGLNASVMAINSVGLVADLVFVEHEGSKFDSKSSVQPEIQDEEAILTPPPQVNQPLLFSINSPKPNYGSSSATAASDGQDEEKLDVKVSDDEDDKKQYGWRRLFEARIVFNL